MREYRTEYGKGTVPMSRREKRMLLRLVASAAVLLCAVGVKLTAPETLQCWQVRFERAIHAEMDVQEVFAAVGRAVSGESDQPWQEVYQAVFSPRVESTVVSSAGAPQEDRAVLTASRSEETNVSMTQQVLGFAFAPPVEGVLTSSFGRRESPVDGEGEFHYGLDLAVAEGTEIYAFADGTVRAVGDSSSLGHYLILDHAGGYSTLYAHCSRVIAAAGNAVALGEPIAEVGQSGNATGPHLHFELYRGSTYLNPVYYL